MTMDSSAILRRARILMDQHGLHDWQVGSDHARRRAGRCLYAQKLITLSVVLLPHYPPEMVDKVILHEIAHAIAGVNTGHGREWKAIARRIGADPRASLPRDLPQPTSPWVGTCPSCGATRHLYRAPRRVVACGSCSRVFDHERILVWQLRGVETIPPNPYARELRSLHARR